jgi:predicted Fe-S protein YdhL (DUF1289 family)
MPPQTHPKDRKREEPRQLVSIWQRLTDDEREAVIPRLLADTKLGARISAPVVPFSPRY